MDLWRGLAHLFLVIAQTHFDGQLHQLLVVKVIVILVILIVVEWLLLVQVALLNKE